MTEISKPIYYLSLLGLLPVIAGVLGSFNFLMLGVEINIWLYKFGLLFSALILSFLGGCLFVFEILLKPKLEFKGLVLSIMPSLWAIISINLPMSSFLLAIGFLAILERERILQRNCELPPGWLRVRLHLTTLLIIALIVMGFNA
ncbi:MAG: hypothetical protein CML39_07785 [Rhodobacteraceae bacterium]|nr:MAG: hypothetical protein CML39_07785 [Paracoccaceae bacterium]|tara:strand:+ start:4074 stop:4508 length:435 start_codon:yes stop_codon:yes gene_type:complete